jgi:hypothetical protein
MMRLRNKKNAVRTHYLVELIISSSSQLSYLYIEEGELEAESPCSTYTITNWLFSIHLKRQCHEIFDLCFFRQSITPRPQMNTQKYFRILFRIRWEINENVVVPSYAA